MINKKKLALLTVPFIGAVVIGVAIFFLNWHEESKIHFVNQTSPQPPLMEVEGVKFIQWDSQGKKLWLLEADKAVKFPQRVILENAKVKLFENGNPASEGTADKVIIEISTSDLQLKGDIHITSYKDKAQLKTSELIWDSSERKIFTEKEVTIKKGGLIIKGKGLIGKPDLSSIIIKEQVTTYLEGGS